MSRTELSNPIRTLRAGQLPPVTVLMPVYNGDQYLPEQIESILHQDYSLIKIIALDDGSSDNSLDLLQRIAREDSRLTVFRNPSNLGLIPTLARLLSMVQTPFFALADQDDVWDRSKIRYSVEALIAEDTAVLVYSDVRVIDAQGHCVCSNYLHDSGIRPIVGSDPVPFVFRNPAIGHTIVARAVVAEKAKAIPANLVFHESWLIGVACKEGRVIFINKQLGSYRQHEANTIGRKRTGLLRRIDVIFVTGQLRKRQLTRSYAMDALAKLHPSLMPLANLMKSHRVNRLLGLPYFAKFMLHYIPVIGFFPVMAEIFLFAFAATPRIPSTSMFPTL